MHDDLQLAFTPDEDIDLVELRGELDLYSSKLLQGLLTTEPLEAPVLVMDLSAVTFLDSSGIGVLVGAMRQAGARGGEVAVVASHRSVVKMLRIAGLHNLMAIYPTLSACREDLRPDDDW